MVDTLTTPPSLHINFCNNGSKYYKSDKKSVTVPDNGHQSDLIKLDDFTLESERLKTFANWQSDAVGAEELAKAGFYHIKNPVRFDLVKCAFCKAEICSWEVGDVPLDEHEKWSPNCSFLKSLNRNNESLPFLGNTDEGQDVCGNAELFPYPEREAFRLLQNMVNKFDDEKVRLETFSKWPSHLKQKPEDLAAAGFYYTGRSDHVTCFECGQALREWKEEDVPWEQHALWFPSCNFVLSRKGEAYIHDVKAKYGSGVPCNNETKEKLSECTEGGSSTPPDDVLLCKICGENERNVIFIPCKHILACATCATKFSKCPVCRNPIQNIHKVYLS